MRIKLGMTPPIIVETRDIPAPFVREPTCDKAPSFCSDIILPDRADALYRGFEEVAHMAAGDIAIEVRGSEVRCSGTTNAPHAELVLTVPKGDIVTCPICNQSYKRNIWWNMISVATWPRIY